MKQVCLSILSFLFLFVNQSSAVPKTCNLLSAEPNLYDTSEYSWSRNQGSITRAIYLKYLELKEARDAEIDSVKDACLMQCYTEGTETNIIEILRHSSERGSGEGNGEASAEGLGHGSSEVSAFANAASDASKKIAEEAKESCRAVGEHVSSLFIKSITDQSYTAPTATITLSAGFSCSKSIKDSSRATVFYHVAGRAKCGPEDDQNLADPLLHSFTD